MGLKLLFLLLFGTAIVLRSVHSTAVSSSTSAKEPEGNVSLDGMEREDDNEDDDDEDDEERDAGTSEADDDGRIYKNPRNSPSALCPRDEDQATLLGQKCLRKCSSDEDCKSKKKKCLCDGACGMSCIKPDRECPDLVEPELGRVSVTGRLFGDRATYTCQHGYHVVGLQSRTCQADGQWAGTQPACKQNIYCLSPPTIDRARHNALPEQTTFDLDSTLQYYCHTGYVTNGFPRAKCLAIDGQASWYGPDISCEPRSCGPPPDVEHGWHAGECYTFGCRVSSHCQEGFELVGRVERVCQADGTWTPKELPNCVLVTAVQCAPPENPRNGKAVYTSCSYNSVVSYECWYGYKLVGESTRRCSADRKWTGIAPACKEIICEHPGRLWNGWLENIELGTGLGASIIFRCHDGMKLEGHTSTVCQNNGTWRYPLPKCMAPCVVPQVSQGRVVLLPSEAHNGSVDVHAVAATVVQHGESLAVECEPQYEFPLLNHNPVTCNNGTWTLIPRCVPARCKHLPKQPKNGMVIAPKTDHGMRARFHCKDGYTLRGNPFVECSFGNWTGEIPYCQEVYCPFPGYIENGKVLLVGNMGLYDYRPYVRKVTYNKQIMYDCDKGFVLLEGPPGATCIGGHWSPKELPQCVPGQHPRLRWSRRRRRRSIRWKRTPKMGAGTSVKQPASSLQNLRRNNNENRRQTNKSRKKSSSNPLDKDKSKLRNRIPCETIGNDSTQHMSVDVLKAGKDPNVTFSSGVVVRVSCRPGYQLNGTSLNTTVRCVKGKWKPVKPECSRLLCYVPTTPNGSYRLSQLDEMSSPTAVVLNETIPILHGQTITFSCSLGYNIQGPNSFRCRGGSWSPSVGARCLAAPCQLPEISHGQYLSGYRAGLTISNGSMVAYQCDREYLKSTAAQPVECILGELFPHAPACTPQRHGDGPRFLGGTDIVQGGDISVLDGDAAAVLSHGFLKQCGPPARVQGSLVYRNGEPIVDSERSFPDATEITFHCIESIMGEKTTWRIVCEDGSWIGRARTCDADEIIANTLMNGNNSCTFRNQEPHVVSFYNDQEINADLVEFPPGAVVTSRCVDIGKYAMIGSSTRRCRIGGEWDGHKPSCFGLNQENEYAVEKPPTILFRHQHGPIAQSNDGKLVVYPGTILHMECLWMRRFGNPKWNVSHDYRKYPEGWTTDLGRDPQLEYRLSIYHAARDDSGVFTCVTPTRHTHAVEIIVKAVHCPAAPQRRSLTVSSEDTKMNTRVQFSCSNGNTLIGAPELTCLSSGNWSAPFPICESIECGEVISDVGPHLRATVVSREVGGRAVFFCSAGFGLRGPSETVCLESGQWAVGPLPTCVEVQCDSPGSPNNGYVQGTGPFKAGDIVQFNCNPDFMMEGQPIIACQENSRWSGPLPKCVQACSYPGTTISGRMSAVKFFYKIGENITFTCDEGLSLRGAAMLKCLRNGKWSNAIPTCIHNFDTYTDSDNIST